MILVSGSKGLIGAAVTHHLGGNVCGYDLPIKIPPNIEYDAFIDCARYGVPSEQFFTWNKVIEHLKQQNGGKIILFSSIYGHKAPDFGMYAGTEIQPTPIEYAIWKGGTEQATRYLAQKLKPWHIQVNCIAPGGVLDKHSETFQEEYHTAGFADMIKPANILPVVDMLLHPDNVVNGQVITVDGGWSL